MWRRLRTPRWLLLAAPLVLAGLVLSLYFWGPGRAAASPQPPVPASRLAAVQSRTEKLHNRTASRTREEDPDDLPPALTPEQAAQIAVQAVRGSRGAGVPGNAPGTGAGAAASTQAGRGEQRSVQPAHEGDTAVFSIVVDGTVVEVDRTTGRVVSMHKANP